MQRRNAGDTSRGSADFECQVGGVTALVSRSSDMASHPLLPELTGTKDKQCQAYALTSDVHCQAIKATTEAQCQAVSSLADNAHSTMKVQKQRKINTVCSASQCHLPSPATHLADAQSQTYVRGAGLSDFSSSDVCSQTDPVAPTSGGKVTREETDAPAISSSSIHNQRGMTSTSEQSAPPPPLTDDRAVQAVISSSDAINQTDTTSAIQANRNTEAAADTLAIAAPGGQILPELDCIVQASRSRDFQCQAWPDLKDVESQAGVE